VLPSALQPFSALRIFSWAAIAAVALTYAPPAFSRAAGIAGRSGKVAGSDCNDCHNGGAAPTVSLTGPATVTAGMTAEYTFTITTAQPVTGMAASASDNITLVPGVGLKLLNAEVVHAAPVEPTAGVTTFKFSLQAPATPQAVMLWAAGNAGNNDNTTGGDLAALDTLTVNVVAAVAGTDAGATPAGVPPTDADGGTTPSSTTPGAVPAPGLPPPPDFNGDGGATPYYLRGTDDATAPEFADTSCGVGVTGRGAPAGCAGQLAALRAGGMGLALAALALIRRARRKVHE
jgi:hypothetical protein